MIGFVVAMLMFYLLLRYTRWTFPRGMRVLERPARWTGRKLLDAAWRAPVRRLGLITTVSAILGVTLAGQAVVTLFSGSIPMGQRIAAIITGTVLVTGAWWLLRWRQQRRYHVRPLARRR